MTTDLVRFWIANLEVCMPSCEERRDSAHLLTQFEMKFLEQRRENDSDFEALESWGVFKTKRLVSLEAVFGR